jgi:hypothetical protein
MVQHASFNNWLVGVGIAAAVGIIALAARQRRKRTSELAALAQGMGFAFIEKGWQGPELSSQYKTSLLQRTRGRYSDVMTGSIGSLRVSVFDYTYGGGKESTTRTMTCYSQTQELPPFELRPERIFDKIGDAIFQRDIDFDSHPDFSRRYHLRAQDEMRIRMIFNPSLLAYLEQIPPNRKWHVETSGPTLIVYRHGYPVRATEIQALLDESSAIAKTILENVGIKTR